MFLQFILFSYISFHFMHFLKLQDQRPEGINLCQMTLVISRTFEEMQQLSVL